MRGRWVLFSLLGLLGLAPLMILAILVDGSTDLRRVLWPLWVVWAIVSLTLGLSMSNVARALQVDDLDLVQLAGPMGTGLAAANMVLCLVGLFMSTSP
jgi:hypothetical protein